MHAAGSSSTKNHCEDIASKIMRRMHHFVRLFKRIFSEHSFISNRSESERNALNIQKTKYATCEKERSALVRPVMINTAPDDDGDVKRQSKLKKNKTITKQPNDYLLTDNDGTADDAPIPPKPQYKCAECDLDFPKVKANIPLFSGCTKYIKYELRYEGVAIEETLYHSHRQTAI